MLLNRKRDERATTPPDPCVSVTFRQIKHIRLSSEKTRRDYRKACARRVETKDRIILPSATVQKFLCGNHIKRFCSGQCSSADIKDSFIFLGFRCIGEILSMNRKSEQQQHSRNSHGHPLLCFVTRWMAVAFLVLWYSGVAFAQTTTVTGQVKDVNGVAYAGATMKAQLVLNGAGVGGQPTVTVNNAQQCASAGKGSAPCQVPFQGTNGPITLDPGGNIPSGGLNLQDNSLVTPAGTQWLFSITSTGAPPPLGTGPQACTATLTITGATQNISASFNACPALSNTSTPSAPPTPTVNALYASPACPSPTPTNCFPVKDDVQVTVDAIYTAASTTVGTQVTDFAFVASTDVGKIDFGVFNCAGTVSNCTNNCPQSTIQSVTDAHHVVVGIACTNNSSAGLHTNNFFWGTDDFTPLNSAFQTLLTGVGNQRQNLFLPCGMMFQSATVFAIPSTVVNTNGGVTGCGGGGATVIVPLPKMNCSNNSNAPGCLIGDGSFPLQVNGANLPGWVFRNITFWGGGTNAKDAAAVYSNPAIGVFTSQFDELDGVYVIGWVSPQANTVGMRNVGSYWTNSGTVAAGATGCQLTGANGVVGVMSGGQCGGPNNATSMQILNGASGVLTSGVYVNQAGFGVVNSGGFWFSTGDHITNSFSSNNASAQTYLTSTWIDQFGGGNSAITISAGQLSLSNVKISATGAPVNQTVGTIFDNGGNVLTGTATSVFTAAGVIGNASLVQSITNPTVASRLTSLGTTQLLPALRWPGPNITVLIYAYDSAAGSGCTGNTTVTWTVSYTDPTGTAQTSTATETITTNGGSTGGDAMKAALPISVNANTVINYSTTYAIGTGCTTGPSYAANLRVS